MAVCDDGDKPLGFLNTESLFIYWINGPIIDFDKVIIWKEGWKDFLSLFNNISSV
jgi:hypothetical protein